MATVAVVFHSGYGHTQRFAQSVASGAGAELVAIDADGNLPEGGWETLATADAIVYATALYKGAQLLTCDAHFEHLPKVVFWSKKMVH